MEASGLTPSDQGWLQKFQWTVNEVIESLGGDDKISVEYGDMARVWNETEPPEELQRK
jgi:hypothetical protein